MRVHIVGKSVELSEVLKQRITEKVTDSVEKYFHRPGEAMVALSRSGRAFFRVDCSLHLPSGAMLTARGEAEDAYVAAEQMLERLEKRLRRYGRRLKDHHNGAARGAAAKFEETALYVIERAESNDSAAHDEDGAEANAGGSEPIIIAESTGELHAMAVGDAVHEMDLTDSPFLLFRNAAHGELNVVYRRPDGHIGWIDLKRSAAPGQAPAAGIS
jgi:ribosomal subunit interface protein